MKRKFKNINYYVYILLLLFIKLFINWKFINWIDSKELRVGIFRNIRIIFLCCTKWDISFFILDEIFWGNRFDYLYLFFFRI